MEEFKSNVLGLWSLSNSPTIKVDIGDVLKIDLGAMLLLHRYHTHLLKKGDEQFSDYHIGNTIFLNHLLQQGVLMTDRDGRIVDMNVKNILSALEGMAKRVIAIRLGKDTIQSLYDDLHKPYIYDRFPGWGENQAYFETLWTGL